MINNCFFVCYSPLRLMNANLVDFQSQEFWRTNPQVAALKVGALDMWFKAFIPQEQAGIWRFPPYCMAPSLWVGFMARVCFGLSYQFQMFSHLPDVQDVCCQLVLNFSYNKLLQAQPYIQCICVKREIQKPMSPVWSGC